MILSTQVDKTQYINFSASPVNIFQNQIYVLSLLRIMGRVKKLYTIFILGYIVGDDFIPVIMFLKD